MNNSQKKVESRACTICQSPTRIISSNVRGHDFRILRCTSCGVETLDPMPTWQQIKSIYDASYYKAWGMERGENDQVARMKRATFALRIQQIQKLQKNGPILDVGTASGFFLEVARDAGFDPYGVELSDYSAAFAIQKFGADKIHHGTLETAPFPNDFFSAIAMSDLIEHVTSPVDVMKKARELLEPGGIVMIMTPNTDSLTRRLMGLKWTHYKLEHLFYFNHRSMRTLAEKAGLEVVTIVPARKTLTLEYFYRQMLVYPHKIIAPLTKMAHAVFRPWVHTPFTITIGEMVAILQKKA